MNWIWIPIIPSTNEDILLVGITGNQSDWLGEVHALSEKSKAYGETKCKVGRRDRCWHLGNVTVNEGTLSWYSTEDAMHRRYTQ